VPLQQRPAALSLSGAADPEGLAAALLAPEELASGLPAVAAAAVAVAAAAAAAAAAAPCPGASGCTSMADGAVRMQMHVILETLSGHEPAK
jgi:hypothetical protein